MKLSDKKGALHRIQTPVFGYDFLKIARSYVGERNSKEKLYQSIKIIIFSVAAAEAFANLEANNYLTDSDLEHFIRNGPKNPKDKPQLYRKWDFLLEKAQINPSKKTCLLDGLEKAIEKRNELIHFKPHKNITIITHLPKKQKMLGPNGKLYTAFQKSGKKIETGVLTQLTLKEARKCFKNADDLIFEYYSAKRSWPTSKEFLNFYYGRRSPAWGK